MSFIYYLPEDTAPSATAAIEQLDALGLADVLTSERSTPTRCTGGPDGGNGWTIARGHTKRIGYYPDEQQWAPVVHRNGAAKGEATAQESRSTEEASHWVGLSSRSNTPADYARAQQYPGHLVKLCDGNEWLVPCAEGLPATFRLDPKTGQMVLVRKSEFSSFSEDAIGVMEQLAEGTAPYTDIIRVCARALGLNYLVGTAEVLMLGLVDETNYLEIFAAIQDYPSLKELEADVKKKEAEASPTDSDGSGSGSTEGIQDTSQPSPT